MFLGFVSKELEGKLASTSPISLMWFLWDININKRFFKKLKTATNKSSMGNYYSAFASGRLWMEGEGNCPQDYIRIMGKLDLLSEAAKKKRLEYIEDNKNSSTKEDGILRTVYLQIYHGKSLWEHLYQIYDRLQKPGTKLTAAELTFSNGFLCYILLATNYMRSGNLSLIESKAMEKALSQSLGEFYEKFPDEDIRHSPRRLDRDKTVPAVMRIPKGTKTKKPVDVVVLRPRDVEALLLYARYVCRSAPFEIKTSKFFFNTKGECLGTELDFYLRRIRQREKLEGLALKNFGFCVALYKLV